MMTAIALLVVGLRASDTTACILALLAFGRRGLCLLAAISRGLWRRRITLPRPEDVLVLGLCIGAWGGIVFIGKRVLLAIVLHQQITFDRGAWDALGTALGFVLLSIANFLPAWSYARENGNTGYGRGGSLLIIASGVAFAIFYGVTHGMV